TAGVAGLFLAAVPRRESVRDVLVCRQAPSLAELPEGARVGTGSTRRRAQLLHHRPDLEVVDIRGNVDTRLARLDEGRYDAIILAEAGLKRLGLDARVTERIDLRIMLPAIGQGALGLETRSDDRSTRVAVSGLDDVESHTAVLAERALLAELRGGCLAPVAAWARTDGDNLVLVGRVLSVDGKQRLEASETGELPQSVPLGQRVARLLADQGAAELIAEARPS
ncbi:MAG: hydroxymethylbilane synthase, partial [Thermoguttaceae bacterium]